MKHSLHKLLLILFAAGFLTAAPCTALSAAFVVDRNDDSALANACTEAPDDCSLRGAIGLAGSLATDDIITFDPNVFSANSVILLNSAVLPILGNGRLTIDGSAAPFITVDAQDLRGAFEVRRGASLTVLNLTVTGGNGVLQGGGAFLNRGTLELFNTTVSGNRGGAGGAIYNLEGVLVISNSTICDNRSSSGAVASIGAIASAVIRNSTICRNLASSGGGIYQSSGASVSIENTIVANNSAGTGPDVNGTITSLGFNLVSNSSAMTVSGPATADQYDVDPLLDPAGLADNGGNTFTVKLLPGSPAIDAGNSSEILDQRGEMRPADDPDTVDGPGNVSDVGAFEFQPVIVPPPPNPTYGFQGFQKPIDPSEAHRMSAGGSVPVRFSLGGDFGMYIFLEGYPASVRISCETGATVGDPSPVVMTGEGLRYDPQSEFYSFTWRTDRSWRNSCRRFVLGLNDGSVHTAEFTFR